MRAWTVVRFVLRAIFISWWGRIGFIAVVLDILWKALSAWQTMDFLLQDRMMPLADILNSLWGTVVVVIIGFLLMVKAVHDRWPESPPTELEAQERWRRQEALDAYLKQMQRWLDDENKPLLELPPESPHRRAARTRTLEVLKRLDPDGKRSVVLFLHEQGLIKQSENVISLRDADLVGANLAGMSLTDTNLDYAILRDADLSRAKFCRYFSTAKEGRVTPIQEGDEPFDRMRPTLASSFFNAKLDGANLEGAALAGCWLQGAHLAGADLDRADLRGAELRMTRDLARGQIERAYGSCGQEGMPDTKLPDDLEPPEAWRKPLSQQKSER